MNLLDIDTSTNLAEFEAACLELTSSKYILSDKKISSVLKVLAKSPELYSLLERCLKGFNFREEFAAAKITLAGHQSLQLPTARRKVISFVFCLLLSFDLNQTDFKKFLSTFYFSPEGPNKSFEIFSKVAIMPFCEAVIKEFHGESEEVIEAVEQESIEKESTVTYSTKSQDKKVELPKAARATVYTNEQSGEVNKFNNLLAYLKEIGEEVYIEKHSIDSVIFADCMQVSKNLYDAIKLGDVAKIKTEFVGFKDSMLNSGLAKSLTKKVEGLQKEIEEL